MTNSSIPLRRVVVAAGLAVSAFLAGCSTPAAVSRTNPSTAGGSVPPGEVIESDVPDGAVGSGVYARRVEDYRANPAFAQSHQRRILYADALLHLGRARAAIDVLIETEIAFPDAYLNALYLGLAYEIAGDLRMARHWVARTIERNVDARGGSEWLHLAMLDARIALARDPSWLKTRSVLANNTHRTAEAILEAIRIQLAVRGDFGLPVDMVICDLYFEAGVCASGAAARQGYFARSLEIGSLRRGEIERHGRITARAHASVQVH